MKLHRSIRRALSLTLVLMLLSMTVLTALATGPSYYVTVKTLYVRRGPSSGYSVKDRLHRGDVVVRYRQSNGWYYVKYRGGSGWVYRGYLSTTPGSTGTGKYKTTCNLYVRARASVNSAALTKLHRGTRVTVLKASRSWAYIRYSGGKGWVAAKYLRKA